MEKDASPLVSVVTAFFNEQDFLAETIESVLAQTYPHWELILVDDGSPDGSTAIAKRYAEAHPDRVFYYQHEDHANCGVCRSRNLGISKSRGEFVAYLDADDKWLPSKLENQLMIFQKEPMATVLLEASRYWHSWENPDFEDVVIAVGAEQNRLHEPPALLLELYPIGTGAAPCPSGIMVRSQIHKRILFVTEFVGDTAVYEDQAFLTQLYANEKVYVSSQANNLYRQRAESQVYRVHSEGRYHRVRHYFLNWLEEYLKKNSLNDRRVMKLLGKALLRYRHPRLFRIKIMLYKMIKGKKNSK